MSTIEIAKMSKIERLRAMEDLWDSLSSDDPEIESPEWHQHVLDGRKKDLDEDLVKFISLEEVKLKRGK